MFIFGLILRRLMLICLFATSILPSDLSVVAIKNANLRNGPGSEYDLVGKAALGDKFTLLAKKDQWFQVKNTELTGWLSASLGVASDDSAYLDRVLITANANLIYPSKKGGGARKLARTGEIAQFISADVTSIRIKLTDGTSAKIKDDFAVRIGPRSRLTGLGGLLLSESGLFQKALNSLERFATQNTYTHILVILLSILLILLPLFLISVLSVWIAAIKPLPNLIVKVFTFFISLIVMGVFASAFTIAPLIPVWAVLIFILLTIGTSVNEWKEIGYNRCPKCHTMWVAEDRGTRNLGTWIWKTRDKGVEVRRETEYADDRHCQNCGYNWSLRRTR